MKKTNKLNTSIKISLILLAILAVLNLVGSNLLATQGRELNSIRQKYTQVQKENRTRANQVARLTSLSYLESWAMTSSYVQLQAPLALATPAPLAHLSQ